MSLFSIVVILAMTAAIYAIDRHLRRALLQRDQTIASLQRDIGALMTAGAGISGHLTRIERHLAEFDARQNQLETSTRVEHSYSQAIRLVNEGADAEQLIENCGLVRDEAELLRTFYQRRKAS